MYKFIKLFSKKRCAVIGMIHVNALPGTPLYHGSVDNIVYKACHEAEIYLNNNIDGLLVENMNDLPYIQAKHFTPEVTAVMSRICCEIRKLVPKTIPVGVQVLAGGNKEALAIAKACSLNFIRAEGFVFSHIADEGFTDANAGNILRYRNMIDANEVLVFADIKKKHSSHAITGDISLEETAEAAEFFLADGLILTGKATGDPAKKSELETLKQSTTLPIIIGSGVTVHNIEDYKQADAFIIGSHFKQNGQWQNELDSNRVRHFMEKANQI